MTYKLKQESDNYEAVIRFVQSYDDSQELPITSIGIPGSSASNSLLLGLSGQEERISITADLYNNGVRIDNNTAPGADFSSGVISVSDQVLWWKKYMQKPNLGVKWTLTGPGLPAGGVEVHLTRVSTPRSVDNPLRADLIIELNVGEVLV